MSRIWKFLFGVAVFAFTIAHMQDVNRFLAIGSMLFLFFVSLPFFSLPKRLPIEIKIFTLLGILLLFLSIANKAWANLTLVEYIPKYGKFFYVLFLFFMFYLYKPNLAIERYVYSSVVIGGFFVSVLSLFSYFILPISIGNINLTIKIMGKTYNNGLLDGKNSTAAVLGMVIIVIIVFLLKKGMRNYLLM